jgi:hypothetical protein
MYSNPGPKYRSVSMILRRSGPVFLTIAICDMAIPVLVPVAQAPIE